MKGVSLMVIQDYSDEDVRKTNGGLLMEIAKDYKAREDKSINTFFTANGGGPIGFIRGEVSLPQVVAKHNHELVKKPMEKPEHKWFGCDGCRKDGEDCTERYRCDDCDFDYCEKCIVECEKPIAEEAKSAYMVMLDVKSGDYWMPVEGKRDISKENMLQFIQDKKDDKLEKKKLASQAS